MMRPVRLADGWWLMAGAGLFWEKSTADWLRLVAGDWFVLREKYCWLVADKPSEQAVDLCKISYISIIFTQYFLQI
jgi:hypothetical protein